jgi:hypothetical protein
MHHLPGAVLAPDSEIVVHDLPRGEVVGRQPPRAAAAHDITDAVEDFPLGVCLRPAARLSFRDIRFEQRPLLVREVGWVSFSGFHAPILPQGVHSV